MLGDILDKLLLRCFAEVRRVSITSRCAEIVFPDSSLSRDKAWRMRQKSVTGSSSAANGWIQTKDLPCVRLTTERLWLKWPAEIEATQRQRLMPLSGLCTCPFRLTGASMNHRHTVPTTCRTVESTAAGNTREGLAYAVSELTETANCCFEIR